MQLAALKHRTESEDCFVIDHSHVKIRLHTAKDDVEKVIVHYPPCIFGKNRSTF